MSQIILLFHFPNHCGGFISSLWGLLQPPPNWAPCLFSIAIPPLPICSSNKILLNFQVPAKLFLPLLVFFYAPNSTYHIAYFTLWECQWVWVCGCWLQAVVSLSLRGVCHHSSDVGRAVAKGDIHENTKIWEFEQDVSDTQFKQSF